MSAKVYDFANYKKKKCFNCGEKHVCIDAFGNNMCSKCYKELQKYANMADCLYRREITGGENK